MNITLSYQAKDPDEFIHLINWLKQQSIPTVSSVIPPVKQVTGVGPVYLTKQMGPLETLYVEKTGKSMRASPGFDREEVAKKRLADIGVNVNTINTVNKSEVSLEPDNDSSVLGAFDDIDDTGFDDEDVHYVAEDPSAEPF